MDVAMARRLAGESLAACIPEGVSRHIRVVWEDAVRQDADGSAWLGGQVSAPFGIRLRCVVRVSGGPGDVLLRPVRRPSS